MLAMPRTGHAPCKRQIKSASPNDPNRRGYVEGRKSKRVVRVQGTGNQAAARICFFCRVSTQCFGPSRRATTHVSHPATMKGQGERSRCRGTGAVTWTCRVIGVIVVLLRNFRSIVNYARGRIERQAPSEPRSVATTVARAYYIKTCLPCLQTESDRANTVFGVLTQFQLQRTITGKSLIDRAVQSPVRGSGRWSTQLGVLIDKKVRELGVGHRANIAKHEAGRQSHACVAALRNTTGNIQSGEAIPRFRVIHAWHWYPGWSSSYSLSLRRPNIQHRQFGP